MKYRSRRKRYISPSMQRLCYEQASAKIESAAFRQRVTEQLPIAALSSLLLALPAIFLVSVIDPSHVLLRVILLTTSPLLWIAWAFVCLYASLSTEPLIRTLLPAFHLRADHQTLMLVLGLANCVAVVSLLWLASSLA